MRALFDVNMLLALFDPQHVQHSKAMTWWSDNRGHGWASCPLTENGFLRIASQPSYPTPLPLAQAIAILKAQIAKGGHTFWPGDVSIVDEARIDHGRLLGPRQLTDVYLLALAVKNEGRLVTLDHSITHAVVRGGEDRHLVRL